MNYPVASLEWREYGSGEPPILLLHGWGGDLETLAALGSPLSQHQRVVSLSLPGFGRSPEPPEPWGSQEYLNAVVALTDQIGIVRFDVIAHSHGARIAIRMAAVHQDRTQRLIIIGGAGLRPPRSLKTRAKLAVSKSMKVGAQILGGRAAEWLNNWRNRLGSPDWRAATPVMRGTLSRVVREDLSAECGRIKAPTLLIWGDRDTETPPIMGQRMTQLIPGSRLVIIPGAGHYCFLERKGQVLSHIWKHLGLPGAW